MDPFFFAETIGMVVPLALVGFFSSRKALGLSGSSVLEKLKERAGMAREVGASSNARFTGSLALAKVLSRRSLVVPSRQGGGCPTVTSATKNNPRQKVHPLRRALRVRR